jgi:hypothetical protein
MQMNILKAFVIVATALAMSSPAFAGRSEDQIMQHDRAVKRLQAERALAGPVGEKGKVGPGMRSDRSDPRTWNFGHPTERIRR